MSNRDRAEKARSAMEFHYEDPGTDVIDILTDIMHYCDQNGHDFETGLKIARQHFKREKQEEV